MINENDAAVTSGTAKVRTAQTFESLQPGTIVQNVGSGNSYVITENCGLYAIAVRTICVHNLQEWKIVEKPEKTTYSVCQSCGFEIAYDFLNGYWKHTKTNPRHSAKPK